MFVSRKKYESMKQELVQKIQKLATENNSLMEETQRLKQEGKERKEKAEGRVKGEWCENATTLQVPENI